MRHGLRTERRIPLTLAKLWVLTKWAGPCCALGLWDSKNCTHTLPRRSCAENKFTLQEKPVYVYIMPLHSRLEEKHHAKAKITTIIRSVVFFAAHPISERPPDAQPRPFGTMDASTSAIPSHEYHHKDRHAHSPAEGVARTILQQAWWHLV